MISVKVLLDSIEKVKQLSSIISKENLEAELVDGVHIIDAKSIMGIFSLDLQKPIQLNIHSDNRELLHQLQAFVVEK